ncbi:hypothetical protein C8A00DRAFT_46546 [Chaetomidium leptoderma]|uniref:Uncharacterized protein n=1 Tax=Chaetomidium leptoderma TaxID=669021 RepID=A0AAN6VF54_9PEZI|nr:hypothetical protein C8A00DRAFT_46546 [Chaetomidium leptoderma]
MHLPTLATLLAVTTTATASSRHQLTKRCSPAYDPDLALGYYPPAPCWQTFDPACQPYIATGTEMTVDAKHKLAVVYGVSASCVAQIAEELAREADGRKNYGWVEKHGWLTVLAAQDGEEGGRTLVISGMSAQAVERYGKLTYLNFPSGN